MVLLSQILNFLIISNCKYLSPLTEASTAKVIVAATQNLFSTILYEMDMEGRNKSELTSLNSLGEKLIGKVFLSELIDLSSSGMACLFELTNFSSLGKEAHW